MPDESDDLFLLLIFNLLFSVATPFFVPFALYPSLFALASQLSGGFMAIGLMLGPYCFVFVWIFIIPLLERLKNKSSFQGIGLRAPWMKLLIGIVIIFLSIVPSMIYIALFYVAIALIHLQTPILMLLIFMILPFGFVLLFGAINSLKWPPLERLKNFFMNT